MAGAAGAPALAVLPKMQSLDADELMVDEEDDIFGEGKCVFLAGAIHLCLALFGRCGKFRQGVECSEMSRNSTQ